MLRSQNAAVSHVSQLSFHGNKVDPRGLWQKALYEFTVIVELRLSGVFFLTT